MELSEQDRARELGPRWWWLMALICFALSTGWAHSQDFLKSGEPVVVVTTGGPVVGPPRRTWAIIPRYPLCCLADQPAALSAGCALSQVDASSRCPCEWTGMSASAGSG